MYGEDWCSAVTVSRVGGRVKKGMLGAGGGCMECYCCLGS